MADAATEGAWVSRKAPSQARVGERRGRGGPPSRSRPAGPCGRRRSRPQLAWARDAGSRGGVGDGGGARLPPSTPERPQSPSKAGTSTGAGGGGGSRRAPCMPKRPQPLNEAVTSTGAGGGGGSRRAPSMPKRPQPLKEAGTSTGAGGGEGGRRATSMRKRP